MTRGLLLLLLPVVLLAPTSTVQWLSDRSGFRITLDKQDDHIVQCMQSGLEVKHRVEFQTCRRRGSWFDHCDKPQLLSRSIQYDAVSENYRIVTDWLSDRSSPAITLETDIDKAQEYLQQFVVPASALPKSISADKRLYLSVRVRGYCQQDEKSLFTQIPYYLTFGMFRFAGFDTGWVDYELTY